MSVSVLDLSPFLGKVKNRVMAVGIELEGNWKGLSQETVLEHDGSVGRAVPFLNDKKPGWRKGELPSPVLIPAGYEKWMRKYYPQEVNSTCGLHIHMSFRSVRHYHLLMEEEFQETLLFHLEEWGKKQGLPEDHCFWKRLKGEEVYCQKKFWPNEQARKERKEEHDVQVWGGRHGNRYTILNYCWGTEGRGTLELRVIPMFESVEQAISVVKLVLDVTNAALARMAHLRRRTMKVSDSFTIPFEKQMEERSNLFIQTGLIEEQEQTWI
jgi:hypothetical protein